MTTIISLSFTLDNLEDEFANCKEFKDSIDFKDCTHFRIHSNSEVVFYNERTALYSCCYSEYKKKKYITSIYDRTGTLIFNYKIDYDA